MHILDRTARLVLLRKTVQERMLVIRKFRKEGELACMDELKVNRLIFQLIHEWIWRALAFASY